MRGLKATVSGPPGIRCKRPNKAMLITSSSGIACMRRRTMYVLTLLFLSGADGCALRGGNGIASPSHPVHRMRRSLRLLH
jgi:hypothetical protein